MELYEKIKENINNNVDTYMSLVQYMYDNPEIGNEEFKAMDVLSKKLQANNFEVETGYIVPTGFIGKYDSKKPGPTIAYLCEFDALPEVGHGCGHNLIAGIGMAAGIALKAVIDEIGGQVWVVGTPAEENFGGKVSMANAGVFDTVDVAMMIHPSTTNGLGGATNALNPLKFEFFGKNAHGCHPQEGKSALDAAVLSYMNINLLRQYVEKDTFIHGIIREGGEAANVIPAYASMEYYFRGATMKYVKELSEKAIKCVEGACLATGTDYKVSVYECPYEDTIVNHTLANCLKEKYLELELTDIEEIKTAPEGSSDIGSVSYKCPALHGYIKIADTCVLGHSKEMADATISDEGKNGLINSAIALASIGIDLITKPELLKAVKEEFKEATKN